MSLYRHDATGFLCEYATSPGAGYTTVTAFPGDTADRISWWRSLCVDAELGQSSQWHPSLPSSTELPLPYGLAGRGVNIIPARYSAFNEQGTGPPLYGTNASPIYVLSAGYTSSAYLKAQATSANGTVWLSSSDTDYNFPLEAYRRWIFSAWVAPSSAGARTVVLVLKTSNGTEYTLGSFTTSASTGTWTRVYGAIDLSANGSNRGLIGIRCPTSGSGGAVKVDNLMLEELIGDTVSPSAWASGGGTTVEDEQITSLPADSVYGFQVQSGSLHSSVVQVTNSITLPAYPGAYNCANIVLPANNYRTAVAFFYHLDGITWQTAIGQNVYYVEVRKNADSPSGTRSNMHSMTEGSTSFAGSVGGIMIDGSPGTGSVTYNLQIKPYRLTSGIYTTSAKFVVLEFSK